MNSPLIYQPVPQPSDDAHGVVPRAISGSYKPLSPVGSLKIKPSPLDKYLIYQNSLMPANRISGGFVLVSN
jgi:hypothetical protein